MAVKELVRLHKEIMQTNVKQLAIWQQLAEVDNPEQLQLLIVEDQKLSDLLDKQADEFIKVANKALEEEHKWH